MIVDSNSTKLQMIGEVLRFVTPIVLVVVAGFVAQTNNQLAGLNKASSAQTLSIRLLADQLEFLREKVNELRVDGKGAAAVIQRLGVELAVMKARETNQAKFETSINQRLSQIELNQQTLSDRIEWRLDDRRNPQ